MSLLKYFNKKPGSAKRGKKRKINCELSDKDMNDSDIDDEKSNEQINKKRKINDINDDIKNISYYNCELLLNKTWKLLLKNEFKKEYYIKLKKNLKNCEDSGKTIYPPVNEVFAAFDYCPFNILKCVIIGQDPYHDVGQAEGLCFSVKKGIKIPSSLRNIFKEALNDDIKFIKPNHGSLINWAKEGILLLNTVLTVEAHKANSHKKFGWQIFTDNIIKLISNKHDGCIFILWGKQAQKKSILINKIKHKIISSAHPSGLSASRGFYGSKPYSKTNKLLIKMGKQPINWLIND